MTLAYNVFSDTEKNERLRKLPQVIDVHFNPYRSLKSGYNRQQSIIGSIIFTDKCDQERISMIPNTFDDRNPNTWFTSDQLNNQKINPELVELFSDYGLINKQPNGYTFTNRISRTGDLTHHIVNVDFLLRYVSLSKIQSLTYLTSYIHQEELSIISDIYDQVRDDLRRMYTLYTEAYDQQKSPDIITQIEKLSKIEEIESFCRKISTTQQRLYQRIRTKYSETETWDIVKQMIYGSYYDKAKGYDFTIVIKIDIQYLDLFGDYDIPIPIYKATRHHFGFLIRRGEAKTSLDPAANPSHKNGVYALSLDDKAIKMKKAMYNLRNISRLMSESLEEQGNILATLLSSVNQAVIHHLDLIRVIYPERYWNMQATILSFRKVVEDSPFGITISAGVQNDVLHVISVKTYEMIHIWNCIKQQLNTSFTSDEFANAWQTGLDHALRTKFVRGKISSTGKGKAMWKYLRDRPRTLIGNYIDFLESIIDTVPASRSLKMWKKNQEVIDIYNQFIDDDPHQNRNSINHEFEYLSHQLMLSISMDTKTNDGDATDKPLVKFMNLIETKHMEGAQYWLLPVVNRDTKHPVWLRINGEKYKIITKAMAAMQFERILTGQGVFNQDYYSSRLRFPSSREILCDAPADYDLDVSPVFGRFKASTRSSGEDTILQQKLTNPLDEGHYRYSPTIRDYYITIREVDPLTMDAFEAILSGDKDRLSIDRRIHDRINHRSNEGKSIDEKVDEALEYIANRIERGSSYNYIIEALQIYMDVVNIDDPVKGRIELATTMRGIFGEIYSKRVVNYKNKMNGD